MKRPEEPSRQAMGPSQWFGEITRTHTPRRPPVGMIVVVIVALLVGGGFVAARLAGADPTTAGREAVDKLLDDYVILPPPRTPEPPPPPPPPGPDGEAPRDLTQAEFVERYHRIVRESGLVEGTDFSFMLHLHGAPTRWSCIREIPVLLVGEVPRGAREALEVIVARTAEVTGLQLRAGTVGKASDAPEYAIIAFYAGPDDVPGTFAVGRDAWGRGGPWSRSTGYIGGGELVVRDDVPALDPESRVGRTVLAHELWHTLGVRHADPSRREIMAPSVRAASLWPDIGPGDQVALRVVGCDR